MDDLRKYTIKFSKTKKITKKSLRQAFFAKQRLKEHSMTAAKLENFEDLNKS